MKKWHMEGIVGFPGNYRQKLAIPDHKREDGYSKYQSVGSAKESYITRVLRFAVGLFLKYF